MAQDRVGINYIKFAQDEPKLFQLLFMQENAANVSSVENVLGMIETVTKKY